MATLQILITNQRTHTAQSAKIQNTQSMRASLEVLTSELREISPEGGDLVTMGTTSMRIRVGRGFGLVCNDTTRGTPVFRVQKVGGWIGETDSVFVFADNLGKIMTDDRWIKTQVSTRDTTTIACGANPAQRLRFSGAAFFAADSVSNGASVRSFTHYAYGLMQDTDGLYYLGRSGGGTWVPLVGPLLSVRGLSFRYLDANGNVTGTATLVTQIEITLRTGSGIMDSLGNQVRDSVTVRVFTRN
jgi:hypothetical protein